VITDKSTTKPLHAHGLTAAERDIGTLIARAIKLEAIARDKAIADALRPLSEQLGPLNAALEAIGQRVYALEHPVVVPPPEPPPLSPLVVTSIPDMLTALEDDVPRIMLRDGIYPIDPAGDRAARSLFFGDRFARRTKPAVIVPETPGKVLLDGRGAGQFGAYAFDQGVHDLTIGPGFTIDNGTATSTGVVVFGSANKASLAAGAHHIALLDTRLGDKLYGYPFDPTRSNANDHGVYFTDSLGGCHDILIDGLTHLAGTASPLHSAVHFYSHEYGVAGAIGPWNVQLRNVHVRGTRQALILWDPTMRNVEVADTDIADTLDVAVRYEGGQVALRRVVSTGSPNGRGFYTRLAATPDLVLDACDLR